MAGRVATCIQFQNSFKLGMDAYHGHAHLLAEVGFIWRMSKNRPYVTDGFRLGREKGPFESKLKSVKWPQFFFHQVLWPIQDIVPSCLDFWQVLHFLEFSLWRRTDKWPDVSQRANGVESHSKLAWVPHMSVSGCCKKLELFIIVQKNHQLRGVC